MKSAKYVLITGGASGLGLAMAQYWHKRGATLCIADVNEFRAQTLIDTLKSNDAKTLFIRCDVSNAADISNLKSELLTVWPRVDLVINNAGIASADAIEDEEISQWQRLIDVNLLGAVNVVKEFIPVFRRQGQGCFLNVASQAGLTPLPLMGAYNASKAALVSFSETMRVELSEDNIGVSVLCPGFFATNLGESMATHNKALQGLLDKLMSRASLSAADVAERAFDGVARGEFLIQTHSEGKQAFRMKRWFPNYYLKKMQQKTARMRAKAAQGEKQEIEAVHE